MDTSNTDYIPEIYVSYAWETQPDGSSWPPILKNLYRILIDKGFKVHIDVNKLKYKDNIKAFMQELGKGKYIICIIGEKYLKSINCMYEVLQILKYPHYQDRIFPVLLSSAQVYNSEKVLEYLLYWEEKIRHLNDESKNLSNIAYAAPIFEDIEIMNEIRRALASFGDEIGNMNLLTSDIHDQSDFRELLQSIEQKIEVDIRKLGLEKENLVLKEENLKLSTELKIITEKYNLLILEKKSNIIVETHDEFEKIVEVSTALKTENLLIEFENFISLSRNSNFAEIESILGKPDSISKERKYSFNTAYFSDILDISYGRSSNKIEVIRLKAPFGNPTEIKTFLQKKMIVDPKVQHLGKHRDDIINIYGAPHSVSSDNYNYYLDKMNIYFICYNFNDYLCSEICVHYFN